MHRGKQAFSIRLPRPRGQASDIRGTDVMEH
jgi:hypothetical protein